MERKVKIVITLGPSTASKEAMEKLIKMGVDVFRLNFSHANHETHKKSIETIREVSRELKRDVAILQDISGPKIRIGEIDGILELKKGDKIVLTKNNPSKRNELTLSHPQLIDELKKDEEVYFADGSIRAIVVKKSKDSAELEVLNEGVLSSKKGVNLPSTKHSLSAITEKDKRDLKFGAENGVDIVAVSFVNSAKDIKEARKILNENNSDAWIIAKIETKLGVENIGEILNEADGLMVARGDLGIEIGVERVPAIQKRLIKKANAHAKPVIVATQMLLSMVNSPFPTRAEVSDVANAVLDGADAVMLSDETTVGRYPFKAVEILKRTIENIEEMYMYHKKYEIGDEDAIAASVSDLCKGVQPKAIISFTASGQTAKSIAKYRPKVEIYAASQHKKTLRRLNLIWGVKPFFNIDVKKPDEFIEELKHKLKSTDGFDKGDRVIITMGSIVGKKGMTNMIRILDLD
ncbi:pyruvate kinase [Hippea alviniae]|uniref:pyruvate kinase n=1 Tax=Hippea alviniae TaxID=1279027 RepID=UPI0003B65D44|nr:pyruvate kinase [Hippea alviniae]